MKQNKTKENIEEKTILFREKNSIFVLVRNFDAEFTTSKGNFLLLGDSFDLIYVILVLDT